MYALYFNHAQKIMFIPFPLVHAQISVMFILIMIPTSTLMSKYKRSYQKDIIELTITSVNLITLRPYTIITF
jgi:hypothetical protein